MPRQYVSVWMTKALSFDRTPFHQQPPFPCNYPLLCHPERSRGDLQFRGPFVERQRSKFVTNYPAYELEVIFRMVFVVLMPLTVGTISTRPPHVVISSAPTIVDVV
jgi:hypothetical protein